MTEPRWKQRYRAPSLTLPRWAPDDPDHLVYVSNLSGSWQVHAWDRAADSQRQVSDHPTGVVAGGLTPDGARVVWFEDSKGDEVGRWLQQPFEGGQAVPLVTDAEPAWSAGLALGPKGLVAVGLAGRDGFSIRVGEVGGTSEELYRHQEMVDVGGLSRDGRLLVVHHAEHGDNLHPALRAFELEGRTPVADLWDGEGFGLFVAPAGFSPLAGDGRLAVLADRTGQLRPAIWDPASGQRVDLELELPGEVDVADWWPDAGRCCWSTPTWAATSCTASTCAAAPWNGSTTRPARSSGPGCGPTGRLVPAVLGVGRARGPGRRHRRGRAGPPGPRAPSSVAYEAEHPPTLRATRYTGSLPCRRARTAPDGPDRPRQPPSPRRRRLEPRGAAFVDHGYAVGLVDSAAPPATAGPGGTCSRATPAAPRWRTSSPAGTTWWPAAWPTPTRWSSAAPPRAGT